jgi:hypothetical protein
MTKPLRVTISCVLFTASVVGLGYCLWHWWTPWAAGILWSVVGLLLGQALYNDPEKGGR